MSQVTIDLNDLAAGLKSYAVTSKDILKADFALATGSSIDKYTKPVTAIQGRFQVVQSMFDHVVQGFTPEWTALGTAKMSSKELKNYHLKVNYPIVPAEVIGSVLGELYQEGVTDPKGKDITKKIIEQLLGKVADDSQILSWHGEYNAARLGEFGFAMNGINKIVKDLVTSGKGYRIPLQAITEANAVDQIKAFELGLPKVLKGKIKEIHVSESVAEKYQIDYVAQYGQTNTFADADVFKSPLGKRKIVSHADQADNVIFATVEGNIKKLIDVFAEPKITQIQVQDYAVKVFMEWFNGYDFLFDEAVCVANFASSASGLTDKTLEKKLFPHQNFTLPAPATT